MEIHIMEKSLERKLKSLRKRIRKLDSAVVAFSGGVDSSLVMRICREELGEKAIAVTTVSEDYPSRELSIARRVATVIGAKHLTHKPEDDPAYKSSNVYSSLKSLAMRLKLKNVIDGSHKDDVSDRGKSYIAAKTAGVKSPLLESDLSKAEIRLLSKELGLPNWDKPSSSKKKTPVEKAQAYLKRLGMKNVKVTSKSGKITISTTSITKMARNHEKITRRMKDLGFSAVLLEFS
jgi:uncharacterized protein